MSDIGGTAGLLLGLSAASIISIIESGVLALRQKETASASKICIIFTLRILQFQM